MSSAASAELASRIHTAEGFADLVGALRGIAAAQAQRTRGLLAGVQAYADTVTRAMAQALALLPQDEPPPAAQLARPPLLVVFGAEQGFTGGYNDHLLDAWPASQPRGPLLVLGSRAERACRSRGWEPAWAAPAMQHPDQLHTVCAELRQAADAELHRSGARPVVLLYAEPHSGGGGMTVRRERVLPLDLAPLRLPEPLFNQPPLLQLPPRQIVEQLAQEYIAARIAQALLHSHAAEHLARLEAMAAAHDNIARTLDGLHTQARQARQEAITAELVELASGTLAQQKTQGA